MLGKRSFVMIDSEGEEEKKIPISIEDDQDDEVEFLEYRKFNS